MPSFVLNCNLLEESLLKSYFVSIRSTTKLSFTGLSIRAKMIRGERRSPIAWKFGRNWPTPSNQYSRAAPQP